MSKTMPRVEFSHHESESFFCPFCGGLVSDWSGEEEVKIEPCEHTLFIGHDMGFDFVSKRFVSESGLTEDELYSKGEEGIDSLTNEFSRTDCVKFASYQGAPSFYGTYVGFCATPEE